MIAQRIAKDRIFHILLKGSLSMMSLLLVACAQPPPATIITPSATMMATPIIATTLPIAETVPPSSTPVPEVSATQTAVPSPTPTPHPLFPFTIAGLRAREFPGGQINIRSVLAQNDSFTQYYVDYPSDRLTITGLMHVPTGSAPFPVLILLHGYYDRESYFAGAGTWQAAEYFAQQGYLVLSPDLRSWGESDTGLSLFHMGLVADVLSLISSVASVPEADASRIGLWGHSMGGGIATKVLVVDERVQTAVLYAPNSADDADLIARWGIGCLPHQSEAAGDMCNPADIIPPNTPPELVNAYLTAATDLDFLQSVAPLYHLEAISVPIQIHIGSADGALLGQTPPDWSAKLTTALEAMGKEVAYYEYPEQGHFFTGQSWVTMLDRAHLLFDEILKNE